jgi:UDP-N-acetylglucosamine/UDP-N-acetylgalactosamine diphosphorylase
MHLALKYKRLLDDMAARGVKYVDCYGVDNVLVSIFFLQFYSMELSNIL